MEWNNRLQQPSCKLSGEVFLGTGKFGGILDEAACFKLMDAYFEAGGKVIDTGHCYGMFYPAGNRQPLSERVIGRYLRQLTHREFVLCTKGGYPDLDTGTARLDEQSLKDDLNASLHELQVDYVDIYYLHRDDVTLPVSEIMSAMDLFVKAGYIRQIGVSNWSLERILEANDFARKYGYEPIRYVQNLHNLGVYSSWPMGDRTMHITSREDRRLFLERKELQFVAYSAQAYGVFSKAEIYQKNMFIELLKEKYPYFSATAVAERSERVKELARKYQVPLSAIALSYVLSDPAGPAAVIGSTKLEQLTETMQNASLRLTASEITYLEEPGEADMIKSGC